MSNSESMCSYENTPKPLIKAFYDVHPAVVNQFIEHSHVNANHEMFIDLLLLTSAIIIRGH